MQCKDCGNELSADGKCSVCAARESVRVMTTEEKQAHDGMTIEAGASEDGTYRPQQKTSSSKVRYRVYGSSSFGWSEKALLLMVVLAIAAFAFFVVLPVAVVALVIGGIVWFVWTFLS